MIAILMAILSGASLSDADTTLSCFSRNEDYSAKIRVRDFLAARDEI